MNVPVSANGKKSAFRAALSLARRDIALYIMLLPAFAYIVIICYWPMYGVQIAFRNFNFMDGIAGSPWVGLKWFRLFLNSRQFGQVLGNTVVLCVYGTLAGFPVPILLALMMHNVPGKRFKRLSQTITYLPNFISTVVIVGMLKCFTAVNSGFINTIVKDLGGTPQMFMGQPQYFRHFYVWSGVWQGAGWNSIIYMAALSAISPELHEAAIVDGATKLQRIRHIDLPSIAPTIIVLLVLSAGNILSVGYEKVYLMQNDLNIAVSEVISTYTYEQGMLGMKYSYSGAVGLMNTLVNFIMLVSVNFAARKLSGSSLW